MDILNQTNTVELLLLGFYLLLFVIQTVYYWGIFSRLAFYKTKEEQQDVFPPVSIVIAAKNEYHHLKENLRTVLEQDYPQFEVVVVNHASEDDTEALLKELSGKYSHLKPVHMKRDLNFFTGKKFPLSIGIKSAKHEILLLTDADCRPASRYWIKSMVSAYGNHTEVVLGYGPYRKEKGLLNMLIRFDTFLVAVNYLSFALLGLPYMGVGRNLSYKKELFMKNKGFIKHYNISSGDDDLFIGEVATPENTRICIRPEGFVFSTPKRSFTSWMRQKQRHLSTGIKYKQKIKWLLALFSISQWMFYFMLATLLIIRLEPLLVVVIYLLRAVSQQTVYKLAADKLHEKQIFVYSLFLEPLFLLFMPIFSFKGLTGKSNQWT